MSFRSLTLSAYAPRQEPTSTRALLLQAVETVELWAERWHQRRALRELPDHARRDMALSPADIDAEASKPFWRA